MNRVISGCILLMCLASCTTSSMVLLDDSLKLGESPNVQILDTRPEDAHRILARIDTKGSVDAQVPSLLQQMREKAKTIGADAIIPVSERTELTPATIAYNPWIGLVASSGNRMPVVSAYAIVYEKNLTERRLSYKRPNPIDVGLTFNLLTPMLGGYGGAFWVGKNRVRGMVEYYSVKAPDALYRDGFKNGSVDYAFRPGVDYFFQGDLKGFHMGTGIQYARNRVGHKNTRRHGVWESLDWFADFGYLFKISKHVHLDFQIGANAVISSESRVSVEGYYFEPDPVGIYGMFGIGINF